MRLRAGARPRKPRSLKARFAIDLADGRVAFVKAQDATPSVRAAFGREKICLRRLAGLAVPRLVSLPRREVEAVLGRDNLAFIAQELAPGKSFVIKGLSLQTLLGAWCFVVEQLAAFRRVGIVYTDVKPDNVLLQRSPLRVTILDFGHATARWTSGRYSNHAIVYTAGFEAPEQTRSKYLTEGAFVYQSALLLAFTLAGTNTLYLRDGGWGQKHLRDRLLKAGGEGIAALIADCLREDPRLRPRNYEAVLRRLQGLSLPADVLSAWKALRAPYADAFESVGLPWKR